MNKESKLETLAKIKSLMKDHNTVRSQSLNMMAAENIMSPLVREALITDIHQRYINHEGNLYFPGNSQMMELERMAVEEAKGLFGADFVEPHANSGTAAVATVILAVCEAGDKVLDIAFPNSGFSIMSRFEQTGCISLSGVSVPFDHEEMNVDADRLIKVIKEEKPKLISFGSVFFMFPHPIEEIADVAEEVGMTIAYDASHVFGLVAGKQFQDPFKEGAPIVMGSIHKTLPGPESGIILTKGMDEELNNKMVDTLHDTVDGNQPHMMPAKAALFAETAVFGEEYAKQIVRNTKALGQALYDRGFNVLCPDKGFSETHTLVIDMKEDSSKIMNTLEKANIMSFAIPLPWNPEKPVALQAGTQEFTRVGMKESEMEEIASLVERVHMKKENPLTVKRDVIDFVKDFTKIHYCFEEGAEGFKYHHISKMFD